MHPKYYKSGRKPIYCAPLEGEGGTAGPLDTHSAGDAIAALLGDDDAPADDAAPVAQADEQPAAEVDADDADQGDDDTSADDGSVTMEIDGQPVTLTREQIADAIKASKTASAATERATQEATEAKRQADAEKAQARAQRDQYAQKLATDTAAEQRILEDGAKQLTQDLLDADPVAYLKLERELRERYQALQGQQAELQKLGAERQQEQEQAARAYKQEQHALLLAAIPEWNDPAKAKAEATELQQFLTAQKFSPQEIGQLGDHRLLLLARKAMQFDQLTTKAKAAATKVAGLPPKVERPGHKNVKLTDGRTAAMRKLGATGSVDDAAALLSSL